MIDIQRQDERGVVEARFAHPEILPLLLDSAPANSKCLQFIDPYGDTTFNPHQAGVLAEELEAAGAGIGNPRHREQTAALVTFVRDVAARIHTYIKFVGD